MPFRTVLIHFQPILRCTFLLYVCTIFAFRKKATFVHWNCRHLQQIFSYHSTIALSVDRKSFQCYFLSHYTVYFIILQLVKLKLIRALESWILRPFSGWRYCFHGHFEEIWDSLKRDYRHSDWIFLFKWPTVTRKNMNLAIY